MGWKTGMMLHAGCVKGSPILYLKLSVALYATLRAANIYWRRPSDQL